MVNVDNVMNVVGAYEGSKSMHVHDLWHEVLFISIGEQKRN